VLNEHLYTETNVDEIYLLNFISGIPCQLKCHISFTCGIVSIDADANNIGQHTINLKGSPERLESFEHVNDNKLKLCSLSIRSECGNQFNCRFRAQIQSDPICNGCLKAQIYTNFVAIFAVNFKYHSIYRKNHRCIRSDFDICFKEIK